MYELANVSKCKHKIYLICILHIIVTFNNFYICFISKSDFQTLDTSYFYSRIDPASPNSLFVANPSLENTGHDVQKYCSCATESPNNGLLEYLPDHNAAVCNITTSLVDCSDQQTTASFLTTCNRVANNGRKRRALYEDGLSERSKSVRRNAVDPDDVIDFEPLIYDPSYSFTYTPEVNFIFDLSLYIVKFGLLKNIY